MHTRFRRYVATIVLATIASWTPRTFGDLPQGALLEFGDDRVSVELLSTFLPDTLAGRNGLVIWNSRGAERWQQLPLPADFDADAAGGLLSDQSRALVAPDGGDVAAFTTQLDQLMGLAVVRGNGFITPSHQGRHLNPQITIRRRPADSPPAYPAAELQLTQSGRPVLRLSLAEGQSRLRWREIPDLPESLKNGLPAGEYTLRDESGGASTTFVIEDAELRDWIGDRITAIVERLPVKESPLQVHLVVENLLSQTDEDGKPSPYYADALDALDDISDERLTESLQRLRAEILARLGAGGGETIDEDATGIKGIDEARRLIAAGRWTDASRVLASLREDSDARKQGLALLYLAVITAESGQQSANSATELFRSAIARLETNDGDLFRAHNNYAGFLTNQVQDRLYNHAFQLATGARNPLLLAAVDWHLAEQHYAQAADLAVKLGPRQVAAVAVNQARLHSLMADIIRTLNSPGAAQSEMQDGITLASAEASRLAATAANMEGADEITRASAHEILANLAYRNGQYEESRRLASRAFDSYAGVGALAGVESTCRLLGLIDLRRGKDRAALNSLQLSQEIAELLRERIPADRVGTSRAAFFARRTYVHELMIELLLEDGQTVRALELAELAKARSLEEVLRLGATATADREQTLPRDLEEIIADWPADTVALQYFLGSKRAWVFVIDKSGNVQAHQLLDSDARPIATRTLVERVTQCLNNIGSQAPKMRQRLLSGQGFDHSWQDELHEFYRILIPLSAMESLREADQVVIIPHHVLHYFPFAALVTQPDTPRSPNDFPKPRHLIDEGFSLSHAPSLATWDHLRRLARPLPHVRALGISEFQSAPPLPGVALDLESIQVAFGDRVREIVRNESATEPTAHHLFEHPGMLMIATHGLNVADDPLSSFILCHPSETDDGRLTAREIFERELQTDLIVMSACYTGLADRSPLASDDLFGLQRAFLHSGARAVVSGLWDVYDGTGPTLMKSCFERLANGESVGASLAGAQRDFLAQLRKSKNAEPWLHPYFWAVYNISGDATTRFENK